VSARFIKESAVAAPPVTAGAPPATDAQAVRPPQRSASVAAGMQYENAVIRLRCTVQLPGGQCVLPSRHDGDCSLTLDDRVVAVTSTSTVLVPAIPLDAHIAEEACHV
jgi:hypothetical protein